MAVLLNGLYLVFLTIVSPWVFWRSWRHGRYRHGWRDKLLGPFQTPQTSQSVVWLHAVSVGEVQVLRTIIETLESERPDLQLAISVTTDSGMDLATKLFSKHYLFYTPFDFTWSIKQTFRAIQPKLIILAELELWPNWLVHAENMGCPVAVINGRLSERSFKSYSRIPFLVRRCIQTIDWVGAQSETYAARFEKLGLASTRLTVTGNIKFDGATGNRCEPEITERKRILGVSDDDVLLLAGSTQSPEESIVLEAFFELANRFPNLKLIIVPRHSERFEEVAKMIDAIGFPWSRRSTSQAVVSDANWRIFLGDSVGELRWWWGMADIGFVGGSFGDRGGQNMIEPCAYGVATCFGPNTRNFVDIVNILLAAQACDQLQAPSELRPWIESMLVDSAKRKLMSEQAMNVCQLHRGASLRTWDHLKRLLPPK